jgi:tetratricopeptide (TPR) repeat protein
MIHRTIRFGMILRRVSTQFSLASIASWVLFLGLSHGDEWVPPNNPNPRTILSEANLDAKAKRYQLALEKYLWIYEKSTVVEPAFIGVRLSFALAAWNDLANEYPPAMNKLLEKRDEALQMLNEGRDPQRSFMDLAGINRVLKQVPKTVAAFEQLDKNSPRIAKEVYALAQPALIANQKVELCGRYLDGTKDFEKLHESFRMIKTLKGIGDDAVARYESEFFKGVSTIVFILAVNDRREEALEIVRKAKEVSNNESFQLMLDEALAGKNPPSTR